MRIEDVMTSVVVTVDPATTVHDAAELLAGHGVGLLPVVTGDDRLVGVVGESDVLRHRLLPDPRSGGRYDGPAPPRTVEAVMSRRVESVTPWTDVAEAAVLMVDRRRRSLPVVRDGRLVGIVSRHDITRVLGRNDEDLDAAITRRLTTYAGWPRWQVHVHQGEVTLCDEYDDPVEQHIATVIAASVPGTVHVETHHRGSCPHHRRPAVA